MAQPDELTPDHEAPEADALEQAQPAHGDVLDHGASEDPEAPQADAAEQAAVVVTEDD